MNHKHGDFQRGRLVIQLRAQFQWLKLIIKGEKLPRPSIFILLPNTNWITDPKEIINAIRLDDDLGIEASEEPQTK